MIVRNKGSALVLPGAIFVLFAMVYSLLGTRDYTAVDGALTPLQLFHSSGHLLDGNNHLLFPFEIWLWIKALSFLRIEATNPIAFLHFVQTMNAFAAAGSVALLYVIALEVSREHKVALLCATGFAFSRVVLLHSTNSAQPVIGLLFSVAATAATVVANRDRSRSWFVVTGVLLAIALASYESMVLIGSVLLFLAAAKRLPSFFGGCVGGWILTFGAAYALSGTAPADMVSRFVTSVGMPKESVGLRVSGFVNLPVGLAGALLPILPDNYQGLRWLFGFAGWRTVLVTTTLVISIWALLGYIGFSFLRSRLWVNTLSNRKLIAFSGVALLVMLWPLVVVNPLYDKLWLQPVAALFVIVAIVLQSTRERSAAVCVLVLVLSELISNLPIAIKSALSPTPYLAEAGAMANIVGPSDLLVTDWDDISELCLAFWPERQVFCLPTEAGLHGFAAVGLLAQRIRQTCKDGGRVYFLRVLDSDQQDWARGYLIKTGIEYTSLQAYRHCSAVVGVFVGNLGPESLRRLTDQSCRELPPCNSVALN